MQNPTRVNWVSNFWFFFLIQGKRPKIWKLEHLKKKKERVKLQYMKRRLLCGCNCSRNNYAFWFYFWQILEEKRVARLILSLDLSHKLAAGVATHWFVALVRVITIHHLDWLNTSLWPEGRPRGGAFASPQTLIHKINWAHAHLSKHVEYIHVNRWQTKVAGRRTLSFFTKGRASFSSSHTSSCLPPVYALEFIWLQEKI